jgi:hypothetical protein
MSTKFFHKYASHKRNINTIWEINKPDGSWVNSFKEIAEVGKQHFKSLSKDPKVANIGEIMKIIRLFPRLIDDEMNIELEAEVSKKEIKEVLNYK